MAVKPMKKFTIDQILEGWKRNPRYKDKIHLLDKTFLNMFRDLEKNRDNSEGKFMSALDKKHEKWHQKLIKNYCKRQEKYWQFVDRLKSDPVFAERQWKLMRKRHGLA